MQTNKIDMMFIGQLFIIDIIIHFIVLWRWIKWVWPDKTNSRRVLFTLIHIVIFILYGVIIFLNVYNSDQFFLGWFDPSAFFILWMFCEFIHLILIWGMIEYGIFMDRHKKKMEELFPGSGNEATMQHKQPTTK